MTSHRSSATAHHAPLPQLLVPDPLAPLDLVGDDFPPSSDIVLLFLLFLLVTSSDVEPNPLALVPRCRSPSSSVAHRLGSAVKSHDSNAQPLPDGEASWANRWSSRLPHGLFRSGGILELDGPTSLEGSDGSGPSAVREGVGEVGGPWCQRSMESAP
jgi:hypothetical protein